MHTWVINYNILFVVIIWTVYNVVLRNKYYCIYKLNFPVLFVRSIDGNSAAVLQLTCNS